MKRFLRKIAPGAYFDLYERMNTAKLIFDIFLFWIATPTIISFCIYHGYKALTWCF